MWSTAQFSLAVSACMNKKMLLKYLFTVCLDPSCFVEFWKMMFTFAVWALTTSFLLKLWRDAWIFFTTSSRKDSTLLARLVHSTVFPIPPSSDSSSYTREKAYILPNKTLHRNKYLTTTILMACFPTFYGTFNVRCMPGKNYGVSNVVFNLPEYAHEIAIQFIFMCSFQ